MEAEKKVLIATYGSLRRGMGNFRVNGMGEGVYQFTGKTKENYNLYEYSGGYFPSVSMAHNSAGKQVVVDVFEAPVSGLTGPYDRLEGYPSFYNRSEIIVIDDKGEERIAWMYHIDEEQRVLVEDGDWCIHMSGPDYYESLGDELS